MPEDGVECEYLTIIFFFLHHYYFFFFSWTNNIRENLKQTEIKKNWDMMVLEIMEKVDKGIWQAAKSASNEEHKTKKQGHF